jgi:xanthine dehydrogenase accessory factor
MSKDSFTANTLTQHVQRVLESGSIAALVTVIEAEDHVGEKLLIEQSGASFGSLGVAALDSVVHEYASRFLKSQEGTRAISMGEISTELPNWRDAKLMLERIEPEPAIVICGAGHVGAALARVAALLGYRGTLIDDREQFLSRALVPDERITFKLALDWFEAVREAIGNRHGVSVAVVTRGHNEDEQCLRAVMTTDAAYVGMIGSKRRTNIVLDRLRQSGVEEERLRRVHAPVGLDIGAVTPEEVALAIMAEIVAHRRGGSGASLSAWRRQ